MNKKYEITNESKLVYGVTVHRIRAMREFGVVDGSVVKAGDLGGWVEREDNLQQNGSAWVADEAVVTGRALVEGHALVKGRALVFGSAVVMGFAAVGGDAWVCDSAHVGGFASVTGDPVICGGATVDGDARVGDSATVGGKAFVGGHAVVGEHAAIDGCAAVRGYAVVRGNAYVRDNSTIDGDAIVDGDATLHGEARLHGEATDAISAIREALNRLFEGERKIAEANPAYDMGKFGRELVMDVERTLIRACCRTESGRKDTDNLYCDVTGIGCVANALDGLDEAARHKEVKFGAVRDCPEASLYAAAAREPRIKSAVRARLDVTVRDVRLRDLPAEEQAVWRAKTRAEKRAANLAAAEKARADGITLG